MQRSLRERLVLSNISITKIKMNRVLMVMCLNGIQNEDIENLPHPAGMVPFELWDTPTISFTRPEPVIARSAYKIDDKAIKESFAKFDQRFPSGGFELPGSSTVRTRQGMAEKIELKGRARREKSVDEFAASPTPNQQPAANTRLQKEEKDWLGGVVYGMHRNLREPIYRSGSRWVEPFHTARYKNPDGLCDALAHARYQLRREDASLDLWLQYGITRIEEILGEGWNPEEWAKITALAGGDGRPQAARLCDFYEICWDSGVYDVAFSLGGRHRGAGNFGLDVAENQVLGMAVQVLEAKDEYWRGVSGRELSRRALAVTGMTERLVNAVLTRPLELLDEIKAQEDMAAEAVDELLGDSPIQSRGELSVDALPSVCDTEAKKTLWLHSRHKLERAAAMRVVAGLKIRQYGWEQGYFMGREWMRGASPDFIMTVAGIISMIFSKRPEYKSESSLAGELHYLRRLIGAGRFYEGEWIPVLDMFRRTDGVRLATTLEKLQVAKRLPEARHRWADIASRARELWRENGETVAIPVAFDMSLAQTNPKWALPALRTLASRPLISAGREALRAHIGEKLDIVVHTETWAGYLSDVWRLKLGLMDGLTFTERCSFREKVLARVMGKRYEREVESYLCQFHYPGLSGGGTGEGVVASESQVVPERFRWSKPAVTEEIDFQNIELREEALKAERRRAAEQRAQARCVANSQTNHQFPLSQNLFELAFAKYLVGKR